jgi:hypothetical protein
MHWTDLIHSLAGLLIVASASSRTMVPLRILAIATNCFLIIYFSVLHAWLPMLLQAAALPLNAWRLYQMLILVSRVREAVRGKPSLDWLKPFMSERHFRKGDLLFAKGETADEMFYTMTGRYIRSSSASKFHPVNWSASWRWWRRTIGAPRRWNAWRAALCCRSRTSRSRSSTTRIRHSASIYSSWQRRGFSTI